MTPDEVRRVGDRQRSGAANRSVSVRVSSFDEAIKERIALFGEVWRHVRTVSIEGYSAELCGGTTCTPREIGFFVITSDRVSARACAASRR